MIFRTLYNYINISDILCILCSKGRDLHDQKVSLHFLIIQPPLSLNPVLWLFCFCLRSTRSASDEYLRSSVPVLLEQLLQVHEIMLLQYLQTKFQNFYFLTFAMVGHKRFNKPTFFGSFF